MGWYQVNRHITKHHNILLSFHVQCPYWDGVLPHLASSHIHMTFLLAICRHRTIISITVTISHLFHHWWWWRRVPPEYWYSCTGLQNINILSSVLHNEVPCQATRINPTNRLVHRVVHVRTGNQCQSYSVHCSPQSMGWDRQNPHI
jgi:hypothetical protein